MQAERIGNVIIYSMIKKYFPSQKKHFAGIRIIPQWSSWSVCQGNTFHLNICSPNCPKCFMKVSAAKQIF